MATHYCNLWKLSEHSSTNFIKIINKITCDNFQLNSSKFQLVFLDF